MTLIGEITLLLNAWQDGDKAAESQIAELLAADLKRIVRRQLSLERHQVNQQTTELFHELFIRLMAIKKTDFQNRSHFFGVASRLVRQILVDAYRNRNSKKRGEGRVADVYESWMTDELTSKTESQKAATLIDLDRALGEFEKLDPKKVRVVDWHHFWGLDFKQTASMMGVSEPTAKRYWKLAKIWLKYRLQKDP